jgi:magnesium transporter
MINAYLLEDDILTQDLSNPHAELTLQQAVWIDLLSPTYEDENLVEKAIGLDVPTRDDMREIEISSRLYKKNKVLFMTASMLMHSETREPILDAVSFILTEKQLVTVRYFELQTFLLFGLRINKQEITEDSANKVLIQLLETAIDRIADILERVGTSVDKHSQMIFRPDIKAQEKLDFQQLLQEIGSNGDLGAKTRESLISFSRLISYFRQNREYDLDSSTKIRLDTLSSDIHALNDHVSFLSNQVTFLLNATLGMIDINQSNIIKIFSIAAVIFLPPTLVASVFGMNFKFMPGLDWHLGYPAAIVLIIISAFIPYQFFKWRKWL